MWFDAARNDKTKLLCSDELQWWDVGIHCSDELQWLNAGMQQEGWHAVMTCSDDIQWYSDTQWRMQWCGALMRCSLACHDSMQWLMWRNAEVKLVDTMDLCNVGALFAAFVPQRWHATSRHNHAVQWCEAAWSTMGSTDVMQWSALREADNIMQRGAMQWVSSVTHSGGIMQRCAMQWVSSVTHSGDVQHAMQWIRP